jgi:hypothetical protein
MFVLEKTLFQLIKHRHFFFVLLILANGQIGIKIIGFLCICLPSLDFLVLFI